MFQPTASDPLPDVSFLFQLREAEQVEVKPEIRQQLREAADRVRETTGVLYASRTFDAMMNAHAAFIRGLRVWYDRTPLPNAPVGGHLPVEAEDPMRKAA